MNALSDLRFGAVCRPDKTRQRRIGHPLSRKRFIRPAARGLVHQQNVGLHGKCTGDAQALLLLAACLTATATMTIGPLSFVGLMAPHIARMMGFRRTMPHIVISALVGGLLLVFADWCGRMVLFPFQIPAGLLSTFIGAPYFIYLLRKQSR